MISLTSIFEGRVVWRSTLTRQVIPKAESTFFFQNIEVLKD